MNLGLIGCGYWGPNIIRNAQKIKGVKLSFCVDSNPAVKEKIPDAVSYYSDVDEALKNNAVDGVVICTPISTHYPIAKKVLLSGVSVLIQKPMAMKSEECEELSSIAAERGLTVMVAHTFLFTASVRKLKELVDTNAIGKLKHFDSVRANLGLFQRDSNVVWDLAPHDFSILSYLVGDKELEFVSAVGASHTEKHNADIANISIKYKDGFSAHIHISWFSPIKVRQITLCGDPKMVVYDDNKPSEKVMIYDKSVKYEDSVFDYCSGDMYCPKLVEKEAIQEELQHFCDCMSKKAQCISGPELGKRVVQLIEAANKSMELKGAPIYV